MAAQEQDYDWTWDHLGALDLFATWQTSQLGLSDTRWRITEMCYSCQEEEGNKKGKGKWKKLKYAKTGIIEHKMQTVFSALM